MIFKDCCYNFQIEIGIGMMYSLFSSMYRRSIQDHLELPLNPSQFSSNVNVSWKIVKNNPHNQWNFSRLSTVDNNISWNDILANLDQNWDWLRLSRSSRKGFSIDILKKLLTIKDFVPEVNPDLTFDMVMSIDRKWEW